MPSASMGVSSAFQPLLRVCIATRRVILYTAFLVGSYFKRLYVLYELQLPATLFELRFAFHFEIQHSINIRSQFEQSNDDKMISLRKSDLPDHLKQGELYRSLVENNEDPHEEVTFPANVLRSSESVNCTQDLDHLLNSLRFWAADDPVSVPVLNFVLQATPSEANISVLRKYETEFDFVRRLIWVATSQNANKVAIAILCTSNYICALPKV